MREYNLSLLLEKSPHQWVQFLKKKLKSHQALPAFDEQHPTVFVLSTGRVGTKTMAALLELTSNLVVYHEPQPKLFGFGKLAYQYEDIALANEILKEAIISSRENLWQDALALGYGYAETSPQITFLAKVLKEIFPQARFIHLVRHPYTVIRSGMRRGWYHDHPADRTRLTPKPNSSVSKIWNNLPRIEKIAWLWDETNRWILTFLDSLPDQQKLTIKSEILFTGDETTLSTLYNFVGSAYPSSKKIHRILHRKLNAQRKGYFLPPEEWDEELRQRVWQWTGSTATQLGYTIYAPTKNNP